MNMDSVELLGFKWEYADGTVKLYVFLSMPFGLSPATYVFYLYFKPFVTRWRSLGMTASI